MNIIKKVGTFFLLSYGVFFFNTPFAMDSSEDDSTLSLLIEMSKASTPKASSHEVKRSEPITIDLVSSDSREEDSFDQILLNMPTKEVPLNRLKRKREESKGLISDSSQATQGIESSQESDSISTNQFNESQEENSFLADGEHYGSDEENPFQTERSYSYDDDAESSSNDEFEPASKRFKRGQQIETEVFNHSSQEDSFDQILLNMPTKEVPLNRLKRKREESKGLISDDSQATQSYESSQEPDSTSTNQSYESEDENSFLADGEHYGSDEESPFQTERSYSHDDEIESSSSDQFEPASKRFKRDKPIETKASKSRYSQRLAPPSKKKHSQASFGQKIKSEVEEDLWDESVPLLKNPPAILSEMIKKGMQLKLLANVYLGNVSGKANIFLPRYRVEIQKPNGKIKILEDWFKTKKDEICVFASGGLHYIWEKNVRHVNDFFFGERVKIIRAHWSQKHLYKNKHERTLEEDFGGKKQKELHSEYYYDLFFRKYFVPYLKKQVEKCSGTLKNLTINGFSWWDVCNKCEKKLSSHKELLENELLGSDVALSYKIAAYKPYKKNHPPTSLVEHQRIPYTAEQKAWESLWSCIAKYTEKIFKNEKEKKKFWGGQEGGEVCKFLGQAFCERRYALNGKETSEKEGNILSLYKQEQPQKVKALKKLLSYLQDENWDLSCWFKGPRFVNTVQPKWKRHWKQVCVPHFGWQIINYIEQKKQGDKGRGRKKHSERQVVELEHKKDWDGACEMCGYQGIDNVSFVFHPKFHGSKTFSNFSPEEQKQQESALGYTHETPLADLSKPLQIKRRQSLCVGSECVKTLLLKKKDITGWWKRKNNVDTDSITRLQAKRLRENDLLDEAEKGLRREKKRKKK